MSYDPEYHDWLRAKEKEFHEFIDNAKPEDREHFESWLIKGLRSEVKKLEAWKAYVIENHPGRLLIEEADEAARACNDAASVPDQDDLEWLRLEAPINRVGTQKP